MISYYQLKKNGKKSRGGPKIRSKLSEMRKYGKNWYYMHLDPKKYTENYKMRVIQKKEGTIKYYQLKKNWKKMQGRPKYQVKVVKNEKN